MLKRESNFKDYNKLFIEEDVNYNLPDLELLKEKFILNNINGLNVTISYKKDKSFLSIFKDVKFLSINPISTETDIKLIYKFNNLEHLYLRGLFISKSSQRYFYPEKENHTDLFLDFSNFRTIKHLGLFGEINRKHILNIENCINLKTLRLVNYRDKDLEIFSKLLSLKELTVNSSSIKSLNGIENLENLEYLSLENLRSIRDISQISSLKNLKQLTINTCSKIYDYDALGDLENLEEIELINNRDIKDLKFLSHFKKLRLFRMGQNSNVVDGDLSYTDNIKEAYFPSRKHYNR